MPQMVALLNGVGGAASALVGTFSILGFGIKAAETYDAFTSFFNLFTGYLAVDIGLITLVGSFIAAGKLHRVISQKPQVWPFHTIVTMLSLLVLLIFTLIGSIPSPASSHIIMLSGVVIFSFIFGLYFSIRVGGADMPITISLLNSLSGVAGAIAGMAIGDVLLVAVGGIVGASGLLLTQIMCRAMNRKLINILLAGDSKKKGASIATLQASEQTTPSLTLNTKKMNAGNAEKTADSTSSTDVIERLANAKDVIIVPGYGMALAQAQHHVKQLADILTDRGAKVRFAIHPVAGRMPGHMNVLLAEANVDYESLFQMEEVNDSFASCDAVVVIGANDVLNPSARDAEGTPIYGMPVLNVDQAPTVIICNYDLKPGYAGVDNPLYTRKEGVKLLLGDAKESLTNLIKEIKETWSIDKCSDNSGNGNDPSDKSGNDTAYIHALGTAKRVIVVPGYGMALAQAQHQVKQLADALTSRGAEVRFAIHPVAGRMPGHMNVLLAEANVDYENLFQMEEINDDFAKADLTIVIGANDVLNPAARDAEGTPIYGMPVLNVDQCPQVIICNYDLNPGYAGVENPLYHKSEGVTLLLGDAKESLAKLLPYASHQATEPANSDNSASHTKHMDITAALQSAKHVIIVPGYGMALAQAQHQVKQLADALTSRGAEVRFAIHPVAGRMPGHMNVLLAEANVDYENLFQMEEINDDFAKADLTIVIGANDVLNPAARDAEGTPIYGMPVLNVDQCPQVIICNYDLNPGYAGVENPLYHKSEGVALLLGDAKESLGKLLSVV